MTITDKKIDEIIEMTKHVEGAWQYILNHAESQGYVVEYPDIWN